MAMLVADALTENELLKLRRDQELDRFDEVWEGMYVMHALPNDEHQQIVNRLSLALTLWIEDTGLGQVRPGVNLASDASNWEHDYRCPDVVVFLNDSPSECHGAFWTGGPDLAVEILSPRDQTPSKIDFYTKVGVRELLIIDRDPWRLELRRLDAGALPVVAVGETGGEPIESESLPITLQLAPGEQRPQIVVRHTQSDQSWVV
ncbi:MAG: Uma2 family endonuclease [Planctomycetota bacterium]